MWREMERTVMYRVLIAKHGVRASHVAFPISHMKFKSGSSGLQVKQQALYFHFRNPHRLL